MTRDRLKSANLKVAMRALESLLYHIGKPLWVVGELVAALGRFSIFQYRLIPIFFKRPFRFSLLMRQIEQIGANSLLVVGLTAVFTGMVMAIQLYTAFSKFGAEEMMGYTIFLAIGRELGPVFTALMLISRAVSAMAAELGTMRVTEQIDAIEVLSIDSRHYLIVPRILAAVIATPFLVMFFDLVANLGGYLLSTQVLGVNPTAYMRTIYQFSELTDFMQGFVKGAVFGLVVASIGTYVGYHAKGGARGVGLATTQAVVLASVALFLTNYFLSSIFLLLDW
jgi:phospholipid/cholesterol/gamma-HCH transport system permease protein